MNFTNYLYKQIGSRIKQLRKSHKFSTKKDFLQKLDEEYSIKQKLNGEQIISSSAFSNLENGNTKTSKYLMSIETYRRLKQYFDLETEDFIFGTEQEQLDVIKFFLLLLLTNRFPANIGKPFNPFSVDLTTDIFFSSEDNQKLFEESFQPLKDLNRNAGKLLSQLIASDSNLQENYFSILFRRYKTNYDTFRANIELLMYQNFPFSLELFDWKNSRSDYHMFTTAFNHFVDTHRYIFLEFFKNHIIQIAIQSEVNDKNPLRAINNDYLVNLFSGEAFYQLLNTFDKTLPYGELTNRLNQSEVNNRERDCLTSHYYTERQYLEDQNKLEAFYKEHKDESIIESQLLSLNIFKYLAGIDTLLLEELNESF